jgi:hypothetical protein
MIFSKKNKFVFIKGKKVGGSSIELALSKICGSEDTLTPLESPEEFLRVNGTSGAFFNGCSDKNLENDYINLLKKASFAESKFIKYPESFLNPGFHPHMSLKNVESNLGKIPEDWQVIAIERSPYDKFVSWMGWMYSASKQYLKNPDKTIFYNSEFLKSHIKNMIKAVKGAKQSNLPDCFNLRSYLDQDDKFRLKILKLENIKEDFGNFLNSIGVKEDIAIPHLKKTNINGRALSFLDRESIDFINEKFHDEFETYGYEKI